MVKIAHIINPVVVPSSSDLHKAQPVTFASMRAARAYARGKTDVLTACACYPEDKLLVPEGFVLTPPLTRSVADLQSFACNRKLPILKDILDRLYECSEGCDYLVYTNVDIGLQPYFYEAVAEIAADKHDAFVINRRTISEACSDPSRLSLTYAQAGEPHCGFDCFVFQRRKYPQFHLANACVGANWIGRVLLLNLLCTSERFTILENCHMTFHLGDDRSWKRPEYADYDSFNNDQVGDVLKFFESKGQLAKHEYISRFADDVLRKREQYQRMLGNQEAACESNNAEKRGLLRQRSAAWVKRLFRQS